MPLKYHATNMYILHVVNILKASNTMPQTHAVFGEWAYTNVVLHANVFFVFFVCLRIYIFVCFYIMYLIQTQLMDWKL